MNIRSKLNKLSFLSLRASISSGATRERLLNSIYKLVDSLKGEMVPSEPEPIEKPDPIKVPASEFSGGSGDWEVRGDKIAVPAKFHELGKRKKLASFEKSPLLIKSGSKSHWLMYQGYKDGERYIYSLPLRSGQLEVLYDKQAPWWHFAADVNLKEGVNEIIFRRQNARGEIEAGEPEVTPSPISPKGKVVHAGPALMLSGGGANNHGWGYPNPLWIVKPSGNPRGKNTLVQCNPIDRGTNMDPVYNAELAKKNGCLGVYIDMEHGHSGNGFKESWHRAIKKECDKRGLIVAGGPKMFASHFKQGRPRYETDKKYSDKEYALHVNEICDILIEWDYNRNHVKPQKVINWYDTLRKNGFKGQYIPMFLHPKSKNDPQPWLTEPEGHILIEKLWKERGLYSGHFYPQYEQNGRTQRWAATCKKFYKNVVSGGNSTPKPQPSTQPSGKFPGKDSQFGILDGHIAIPDKYHKLGQLKRLSNTERSPVLFEINHKKYFCMPTGKRDGSRHIYTCPKLSGPFKILWDKAEPWRHEYVKVNFKNGHAYDIRFKTVDRHGRSAHNPHA